MGHKESETTEATLHSTDGTHQFSSVAQSCLALCNSMDYSTPGLPVHLQLPELAQTHVHRVGDAIKPSHPLLSLLLLPSVFPSIRVFSIESVLCIRWPKYWSFSFSISPSNEYSELISFRSDWLDSLQTTRRYILIFFLKKRKEKDVETHQSVGQNTGLLIQTKQLLKKCILIGG